MKFDVHAYQLEVAKRFEERNNGVFEKFLIEKGYAKDGKMTITKEQQESEEFQLQFVSQVMELGLVDVEDFTKEELMSYFIE